MVEIIPFGVATAVKNEDSHAEEVPTVVPVDIPLTTLPALREDLNELADTVDFIKDYIDDHRLDDEEKLFGLVIGMLANIGPLLAMRGAARSPPIPA